MAKSTRTKVDRMKRDETMDDSFPLAVEVRTYKSHLPGWLDRERQFVLIKGRNVLGFYSRYERWTPHTISSGMTTSWSSRSHNMSGSITLEAWNSDAAHQRADRF
jgi:hypothetical protein